MSISTLNERRDTSTGGSCHSAPQADLQGGPLVAIVGNPNVGKSVLFNRLTGLYVTVSNYPGTTVEVSRGTGALKHVEAAVVDTPGMYGLSPITEEERVGRRILLEESPDLVIHVVDAKNLERMLPMTLQLIEAGLPVVLDVNLMDEAERLGMEIDVAALEQALRIPVVATALTRGRGVAELKAQVEAAVDGDEPACPRSDLSIEYPAPIEAALEEITSRLQHDYPTLLSLP